MYRKNYNQKLFLLDQIVFFSYHFRDRNVQVSFLPELSSKFNSFHDWF